MILEERMYIPGVHQREAFLKIDEKTMAFFETVLKAMIKGGTNIDLSGNKGRKRK